MVLEDFAMGHRMNRDRATQRLAGVGAGGAAPPTTATSPEGILTELRGISENNPLAFLVPHGFDYILRVLSALPDPQRCWALVQFYFAKHEWYTKVRRQSMCAQAVQYSLVLGCRSCTLLRSFKRSVGDLPSTVTEANVPPTV